MGNKLLIKKLYLPVALICCLFLFNGCAYVNKVKEINEIPAITEIPVEAIHNIEVMELKKAPEDKTDRVDIQEPEMEKITLSIEECRALTLENNLELRAELIEPTINRENVNQAEAKFEPSFTLDSSYNNNDSPTSSALQPSKYESLTNTLGVDMPLRTGGTLSFDLTDSYSKTDLRNEFLTEPGSSESYGTDFSASISQPLLKGAGKKASTYNIRVQQYNSGMADLRTKLAAIRIISAVDRAYWNLDAARRTLEVRKQQLDLAKATYEETKRFVEVGSKAKIEIIRTRKAMADKRFEIINAENDVREKERALKRMLNRKGLGMETKTIIIPSSPPEPVRYDLDRKSMVEDAIENRMDMLELELQLAMDDLDIENNRNQTLPDITLGYTYNINGLGIDGRGDAYDMLADNDHVDHRITLKATVPIGNKKAKSQLRQAIYKRAKRLATKEDKEAEIKSEVLNKIDNLEANWLKILASRENTIYSDEQYKAEKRQYELGLVNSTDLLKSQTDLADAQRSEIAALTDYQIALIDLAQATGTLLGAARVEWVPIDPLNDNMVVNSAK